MVAPITRGAAHAGANRFRFDYAPPNPPPPNPAEQVLPPVEVILTVVAVTSPVLPD
jgi:hypothetical protein